MCSFVEIQIPDEGALGFYPVDNQDDQFPGFELLRLSIAVNFGL